MSKHLSNVEHIRKALRHLEFVENLPVHVHGSWWRAHEALSLLLRDVSGKKGGHK